MLFSRAPKIYFLRAVLLSIVLTGAFFSPAEGVHLLPFPDSQCSEAEFLSTCDLTSYSFSVRNSNQTVVSKAASQKGPIKLLLTSRHHLITGLFALSDSTDLTQYANSEDRFLTGALSSESGRGPPTAIVI